MVDAMQSPINVGAEGTTSSTIFKHMVDSVSSAQKLILQQCGTLTTLVMSVIAQTQGTSKSSSKNGSSQWVAMTLTVGDSSAFVYRRSSHSVDELTWGAHADMQR